MPELQQPDIVGNFLSSYYTAQQKQQSDADRQRNMMRQDRADSMAEQKFGMDQQAHQFKLAEEVVNMLGSVQDGDAQGFERAKQRWGQMGLPMEAVAGFTVADLPALRVKAGTQLRELQAKAEQARINQSNASARAADALAQYRTSGGGAGGSSGASDVYDTADPFAGLSDKARERLIIQNAKDYANVAKENDKEVQGARATATDAARFISLSKKVNAPGDWSTGTGWLANLPGVRQAQTALDSRFSEMDAITARLVPKLREPGSGATSDFDAKMFQRGTLDIGKPGPANEALGVGMQAAAANLIDKARFEEAYFKARKTLVGAQDAWQQYLEDNPIFDPSAEGAEVPVLNRKRVNWKRYFGAEGVAARPRAAAPAADDFSDVDALLGLK